MSQTLIKTNYKFLISFFSILAINILAFVILRSTSIDFIENTRPFSLNIGFIPVILIVTFVTIGFIEIGLTKKLPLPSSLILAGSWSNLIERVIYETVADYIPFIYSFINIADIQIWIGLIWLNCIIWFGRSSNSE